MTIIVFASVMTILLVTLVVNTSVLLVLNMFTTTNGFITKLAPKLLPTMVPTIMRHPTNLYSKNSVEPKTPIYTVIWRDCSDCHDLLKEMKQKNMRTYYINTYSKFKKMMNNKNKNELDKEMYMRIEKPQFYKNEVFIADNTFDMYEYIFYDNTKT